MEGDIAELPTACHIDYIEQRELNYHGMSVQYKDAADALVEHVENRRFSKHPEFLLFPIAYLYRHSLELMLKSLVETISESGSIEMPNLAKSHNLATLWNLIKPELINRWPSGNVKILNNVEGLLNDFQKIDKSGQSLRYHKTKEGKGVTEKLPRIIRLELMKDAFSEIYNLLEGCSYDF